MPYLDALAMLPPGAAAGLLTAAGYKPIQAEFDHVDGWDRVASAPQDLVEMITGAWHVALVYDLLHDKPEAVWGAMSG